MAPRVERVLVPALPLHLTYCTNIHPGDGWSDVDANIRRIAPGLKARLAPDRPFGLGLRLSAREARELREGSRLAEFRAFLDREGLYVAIINGFPYGPFHGTAVKANVYAPDWRERARVEYTLDLVAILRGLLPASSGADGGISTSPLSYKRWMPVPTAADWEVICGHVAEVAAALVRAREEDGLLVHLDIEPEPDCLLEVSEEVVGFFQDRLLPIGAPVLARRTGTTAARAQEQLLDHVRVCFDCCHFAVEYEEPAAAIERFRTAGIQVGRIQLSSALDVTFPRHAAEADRRAAKLRAFADTTYLHQVVERHGQTLRRVPDLADAFERSEPAGDQWRIHFHVPLFTREYDGLGSTQDYVRAVLGMAARTPLTRHLEIETYTWDVLPADLKLDVADSIEREYRWVLDVLES